MRTGFCLISTSNESRSLSCSLSSLPLESAGVLGGQRQVAQHNLLDDNAIRGQLARDGVRSAAADLIAIVRKDVADKISRRDLAEGAGHNRGHNLVGQRLRKVGMDVIELPRVDAVPYGYGETNLESFLGLDL